ncbi:MAG: glycosyltransferase family 4 protein [Sphingomicrobium sp.]
MEQPLRILFLTYSDEQGASARYRVYQFLPYLRERGIEAEVRPLYGPRHYRLIMSKGSDALQAAMMASAYLRRLRNILRARRFDVVFFHREAVPLGPVFMERLARRLGAGTILDLDDLVFVNSPHVQSWLRRMLRNPGRIGDVVANVDCVCAANDHIADYARSKNGCVEMIPGAEDMARYAVEPLRPLLDRFVIGWTGSFSTEPYLELLKPALQRLALHIPNLTLLVIGGGAFSCPGVEVVHRKWSLDTEIPLVRGFNIGVMPLPDDEWSKGKCGGKGRIYMAAGVPSVVSAVGYNEQLIADGETGMLVRTPDEWFGKILDLQRDPEKRACIAAAGREHVRRHLSLEAMAPRLEELIRRVARKAA